MVDDVRELLDGEVQRGLGGFDCATAQRVLFVSYATASDAAVALLLCRERGLLKEKLEVMDRGAALVLYDTTVPTSLPENCWMPEAIRTKIGALALPGERGRHFSRGWRPFAGRLSPRRRWLRVYVLRSG